ncbi:hypothetical protein TNCV_1666731 [Trichonephila clavipes]|nr:hypothetical protein TNCV_1666731 [Trichonephila clavipes]
MLRTFPFQLEVSKDGLDPMLLLVFGLGQVGRQTTVHVSMNCFYGMDTPFLGIPRSPQQLACLESLFQLSAILWHHLDRGVVKLDGSTCNFLGRNV